MSKFIYPCKLALSVLCVALLSAAAFGQESRLQNDLNKSFKKYSLVKLNDQARRQKIDAGAPLTIAANGSNYELDLVLNDIRSPRYTAENTTINGDMERLEKSSIAIYKGKVAGAGDSQVRLTLDGDKVIGFFEVDSERFFVEPARNFSSAAQANETVVYSEKDLLKNKSFLCESEVGEKIERGEKLVATQLSESVQAMRVLEMATEADFAFVSRFGGATQANNEILSMLNMVEGIYEGNLNLSIRVVFQHTWSTADPFNTFNTTTFLSSFRDHWNANYPQSQYPRSETQLFSGNYIGNGLSYIGTVCANQNYAYGFNGWTGSAAADTLLTSHELGHTLGGRHADANDCASTIMNTFLSESTPMKFCAASRTEIGNFVTTSASCLRQKSTAVNYDFDADGKADIALFRPSNGVWYVTKSGNSSFDFTQFGQYGDKIEPGDYDGDGKTDIAVYRAGVWYRLKSSTGAFDSVYFGVASDVPAPADYDGDGKTDVAVFRPADGIWHRLLSGSGNSYSAIQFGSLGDVPVPADYDGDGKADVNVFRPSSGIWYRSNSADNSFYAVQFGLAGDKPLAADFDGDGKTDVAVFRPSSGSWYRINSSNNNFNAINFGIDFDMPTPADYDGDGKADISVYRPSSGIWYRFNSADNSFYAVQFGANADIPASTYYLQ